jgi:predicted PurR-regulated permease PerM
VLRAATGPALLALSLAYLFQPVLHRAEEAWGWSRTVTTVMVVVGLVTVTTALGVFIIPETLEDLGTLTRDLPGYVEQVAAQLGVEGPVAERLELGDGAAGLFPQDSQEVLDQVLGIFGAVTRALGVTAYFVLAGLFTTALFVWWSITFERLPTLVSYLPASRREEIGDLLTEFEQAFGGFLRGQILVALFTSVGFALGFSLIGVPHAFAAAAIGGLMSFIPNGQIAGPASAIAFGVLGAAPAGHIDWVTVALLPGLVYAVTQSLETFVVTPLVQGSYTRLHPLAVFGALLAGGAVGGIIGVFLAVPLTACLRILLQQVILPRIRRAADVR